MRRPLTAAVLLGVLATPLAAQRIDWRTRAVLYGDNTEFFTPYRTGETILGGQLTSVLDAEVGGRTSLSVGLFADRRWGSDAFSDSLKPVLAVAYRGRHSTGVIGTLDADRRHGLIDPLMVSTRELVTPIEYGLQWHEVRGRVDAQAWVNWRKLNTPEQREEFEMGLTADVAAMPWLNVVGQHLWSHRGGQLYDAGVPVSNNRVTALGVRLHDSLPVLGRATFTALRLWSDGHLEPDYPADRPANGSGTWLRASATPLWDVEVFAIHWRGRDFHAAAGDANYGSPGQEPDFYRAERKYLELGLIKRVVPRRGASLDVEMRWHRIDDEESEAFFNTPWEFSYRVVVRAPLDVRLRR